MQFESDSDIGAWVLDKLARHNLWSAKHTSFDNLKKGSPPHFHGKIIDFARNLTKKGLLIPKPTSYGLEVSLNFQRKEEIFALIERWKLERQ